MKNNAANVIPKMKPNPSSTPQPQPPPPQPPQPQLLQPRPPHPQPLNPPPQPNPQLSHLLKCRKDHNHRLHMHHSIRILNQKMSAVAPVQSIQSFCVTSIILPKCIQYHGLQSEQLFPK